MNTPHIHIAEAITPSLPKLMEEHGLKAPILLLCDTRTYAVAGEAIEKQLGDAWHDTVNLGLNVQPLLTHAQDVREKLGHANSLLVVGSGTLNDIGKLAAFREEKPYAVFATAASMNGYASPTASLIKEGIKQSLPARPPVLIAADLDIVAEAPLRLSQAGLGDTLCRPCVEADMLLAHTILGTEYQPDLFTPIRDHENYLLDHSELLLAQDRYYIRRLLESLIAGGNAMGEAGSSAPASQGEHMVAHTLEALFPDAIAKTYHGEHIAITSMSCLRIQHYLMQSPFVLSKLQIDAGMLRQAFGEDRASHFSKLAMRKRLASNKLEAMNTALHDAWDTFRIRFQAITISPDQLELALSKAGISTAPESLSIPRPEYDHALMLAPYTRDRFTFLDIAAMRREQRLAGN